MISKLVFGEFLIILLFGFIKTDNPTVVRLEYPKGSNSYIEKDVIEFIENAKENISKTSEANSIIMKKKAAMIVGIAGTGKSTLVNYLNGIPLICFKDRDKKWKLKLKSESKTLPGGFNIGTSAKSETIYPAFYSPPDKDYSYIDNPGFRDTRGIGLEIASSFLRQEITSSTTHLKFVLLFTHNDLTERGFQFLDTIESFAYFLGALQISEINETLSQKLSSSIGIVITKVDNDNEPDESMKMAIKDSLLEILDHANNHKSVTRAQTKIFEQVIRNNQIEIFSNPKKEGPVPLDQSFRIISMIEKLNYISKEDANIRVMISKNSIPILNRYIKTQLDIIRHSVISKLNKLTSEYYDNEMSKPLFIKNMANVYANLNFVQTISSFNQLNEINENIFDTNIKKAFFSKIRILEYINEIVPTVYKVDVTLNNFTDVDLTRKLDRFKRELVEYLRYERESFQNDFQMLLNTSIFEYYIDQINKAVMIEDIKKLEELLNYIKKNASNKHMTIEGFIKSLPRNVLSKNDKERLLIRNNDLQFFIEKLPSEQKTIFLSQMKQTINEFVHSDLKEKLYELNNFYNKKQDRGYYNGDTYIYKGYFANFSSVLNGLNNIDELKCIKIFMIDSLIIDVDFKLNTTTYKTNSPDLIIISPNVIVKKPISIDLSCYSIQNYSDKAENAENAENGVGFGGDGKDGKPGLPGYNGGNLIIVTDFIQNLSFINFLSNGGNGGPGQNGGNGTKGLKGKNALQSNLEKECIFLKSDICQMLKKCSDEKIILDNCANVTVISDEITEKSLIALWNYDFVIKAVLKGASGEKGGNAGRGGCGGYGGYAGGKLIKLSINEIFVRSNPELGKSGENGTSGYAGLGGYYGDTAEKRIFGSRANIWSKIATLGILHVLKHFDKVENKSIESTEMGPSGLVYKDKNCNHIKLPQYGDLKYYKIITEYLIFLSNSSFLLNNKFGKKLLELKEIRKYAGIDDSENLFELVKILSELNINKEIFIILEKKINSNKINLDKNNQTVLEYMLATLHSSICGDHTVKEKTLVLDMEKFLRTTLEYVRKKYSLDHQNIRDMYKTDYENNLKRKILDAEDTVFTLEKVIDDMKHELNNKFVSLLDDGKNQLTEQEETDSKLDRKKKEVDDVMSRGIVFSVLKIGCSILSLLGTKGKIVATIIETGVDVLSSIESSKINQDDDQYTSQIESKKIDESETNDDNRKQNATLRDKVKAVLGNVPTIPIVTEIFSIFEQHNVKNDKIQAINNQIKENYKRFNLLYDTLIRINEFHIRLINSLGNKINSINTKTITKAMPNFKNFEIKIFLSNLRDEMKELMRQFEKSSEILAVVHRMEAAFSTIFDIYERIDNFYDQMQFANYMHTITLNDDSSDNKFSEEHRKIIRSMRIRIIQNIIMERYKKADEAFKLWSFPFYSNYTHDMEPCNTQSKSMNQTIDACIRNLEKILYRIEHDETETVHNKDNHIQMHNFNKESPFYKWSSQNYPFEIAKFLNGENGTFFADIKSSTHEAVKFTMLNVYVQIKSNHTANDNLTSLLSKFYIELVHSGVSHFKYDGNYYEINSYDSLDERLLLRYQYNCSECSHNKSYKRIKETRPFLSPYTFWNMRIVPINKEDKSLIKEISSIVSNHKNDIVIYLCGKGEFVLRR